MVSWTTVRGAASRGSAHQRLLSCCAVLALGITACGSRSPVSSIALSGALTAQTDGASIVRCGAMPRDRTADATTFELDLRLSVRGATDRLVIAIHDGAGGPGTYHVRPVHGPVTIRLYIADGGSEAAASALEAEVAKVPGVVSVRYVSKDEAAAEATANNPDLAQALATLGTNPLPASLAVSTADTQSIPAVVAKAHSSPLVDETTGPQNELNGAGVNATADPRGIAEAALYAPESHTTGAAAVPDYEGEGTLTLNRDRRSGSIFAELVSQTGNKASVSGSFAC